MALHQLEELRRQILADASRKIGVLILITGSVLLAYEFLPERVLHIDASSPYSILPADDRTEGGKTTSTLTRQGTDAILECELAKGFPWPYCDIEIMLSKTLTGVDLSRFERIRLDISVESPRRDEAVRITLRNANPAYSKPGLYSSHKVNVLEYTPFEHPDGLEVGTSYFQVASWWLNTYKISVLHSQPDLSNVVGIDIATGATAQMGPQRIVLRRIEFRGKWLPRTMVYGGLIALWVIAGGLFLLRRLHEVWSRGREMARLNRELASAGESYRRQARTDPLTGALNRNAAVNELFSEAELAQLTGEALSIVFMDIDHFKTINDTHGHAMGDAVLKAFANLVRSQSRSSDALVRWGGEEFVLMLPTGSLEQAARQAEKLRKAIEAHTWPHGAPLTSSFGVAELGDESIQQCLERADKALYTAKNSGRNQVVVAPASTS